MIHICRTIFPPKKVPGKFIYIHDTFFRTYIPLKKVPGKFIYIHDIFLPDNFSYEMNSGQISIKSGYFSAGPYRSIVIFY